MLHQKRVDEAGYIYHALNLGNAQCTIFRNAEDYEAFLRIVAEGLERFRVDLFCFTLMPDHWHFVVRPAKDNEMGKFMRWITATHSLRYHAYYHTRGYGHIYQSRYKSFPVQDDAHFYALCRYVERNPLRANSVSKAVCWPYGSLHRWSQSKEPEPKVLSPWPLPRFPQWNARVNAAMTKRELREIQTCIHRGRSFGDERWIEKVADQHGVWHTLRPIGRPRKGNPTPNEVYTPVLLFSFERVRVQ